MWHFYGKLANRLPLSFRHPNRIFLSNGKHPTSLELEFRLQFPCGTPSTELSDFRQSEQSTNERECKPTLKHMWKMELTWISISHWLFRCRYSDSRDVVAGSPSFSCSTTRAPNRRACSRLGGSSPHQGPVVRRLISTNTGLNFNPDFFFLSSKALSHIIFFILFRACKCQNVDKRN